MIVLCIPEPRVCSSDCTFSLLKIVLRVNYGVPSEGLQKKKRVPLPYYVLGIMCMGSAGFQKYNEAYLKQG